MLLAYDNSTGTPRIFTIEGNAGNQVQIRTRTMTSKLFALGHITRAILR
jgi:hypothetical protein